MKAAPGLAWEPFTSSDPHFPLVDGVTAAVYEIPTDQPEADGTLAWTKTTLVTARVTGGGATGLGYTYATGACKPLIEGELAELITVKHYWEQWTDPRLVVAVLHNDDLNQVTWEMRAMEGAPKFAESQALPDVDYAAFATSLGLLGINVDKPDDVGPAWDRALAADRPVLLDVRVDPSVPPIPPHATFEQAKDTAKAIVGGGENARSVIVEGIKTKVQEFLPHNRD